MIDVPDARNHQGRQRMVNHRLVVDGHQLLADGLGQRPKTRATPSGENNSFHGMKIHRVNPSPQAFVPLLALAGAGAFLDLEIVQRQDVLLVQQIDERLAERPRGHVLCKAHQERGQHHQVGEHGHEEGHGDEQAEGPRAVEFTHREHEEPKEQHNRVYIMLTPVRARRPKPRRGCSSRWPELLPVFGQEVNGVVHGNSKRHREHQNGRGFDRNARPAHDPRREEKREQVGDEGDAHHPCTLEQQGHHQGNDHDGKRHGNGQVLDEVIRAFQEHDARSRDGQIVALRRENAVDARLELCHQVFHFEGAHVGHVRRHAGHRFGGIHEVACDRAGVRHVRGGRLGTPEVGAHEAAFLTGRQAVSLRVPAVKRLHPKFHRIHGTQATRKLRVLPEEILEFLNALEVGGAEDLTWFFAINEHLKRHHPAELGLEPSEVDQHAVFVGQVVDDVSGGDHLGHAPSAQCRHHSAATYTLVRLP